MAVAFESISNTGFTSWDGVPRTVTITKPTGLAAGDLMVAILASNNSPGSGWDTIPSGWTYAGEEGEVSGTLSVSYECSIYYKIATAGDAAASDFSFTNQAGNGSANETGLGSILRFSGAYLQSSFVDASEDTDGGTANSYTGGVDPTVADSILILAVFGHGTATTVSNYAITTSNPTWTERQDVNQNSTLDYTFAIATGPRSAATATGNYSADFASSVGKSVGILAAVVPPTNATISPSVISAASSVQAPTVAAGASVSTSVISFASSVQAPTVTISTPDWTNLDKSSTSSFTNPDKS